MDCCTNRTFFIVRLGGEQCRNFGIPPEMLWRMRNIFNNFSRRMLNERVSASTGWKIRFLSHQRIRDNVLSTWLLSMATCSVYPQSSWNWTRDLSWHRWRICLHLTDVCSRRFHFHSCHYPFRAGGSYEQIIHGTEKQRPWETSTICL